MSTYYQHNFLKPLQKLSQIDHLLIHRLIFQIKFYKNLFFVSIQAMKNVISKEDFQNKLPRNERQCRSVFELNL